ncbi:MAG: UDP-N-acetylglucosamine 2-epimerase (non-hydrolyzing) [Cyclobacteriaceae bacterium]
MLKKIFILVGTRPNFIKITQFEKQFKRYAGKIEYKLIHTGQHFDKNMSEVFFEQLEIKEPDYYLNISSGSPNSQIGNIILELEKVFLKDRPDLLIVVGDVNSTMAGAIAANKLAIKLAHLESGLRSMDRTMPEEHNRVVTDVLADYYFITEDSGIKNLSHAGVENERLFFVGNTMIDTLVAFDQNIRDSDALESHSLKKGEYVLMTMHRPSNVDHQVGCKKIIELIKFISRYKKIVFPIHPRALKNFEKYGLSNELKAINDLILLEPLDYLSFQQLVLYSSLVVTDSGGIQEETTFRQVPCLTLRPNTERPITISMGSNKLLEFDLELIKKEIELIQKGQNKKGEIPPLWDGRATERIVDIIAKSIL